MPTTDSDVALEGDPVEEDEGTPTFVDAASRVTDPSGFDKWYYGIEDRFGQGTVGMGIGLIVFIVLLGIVMAVNPI